MTNKRTPALRDEGGGIKDEDKPRALKDTFHLMRDEEKEQKYYLKQRITV